MENSQKIRKQYDGPLKVAITYFRIMASINSILLTDKELELVGWLATNKGEFKKEDFISQMGSSETRINNLTSFLRKKGWLLKERGVVKLHPVLERLNFSEPLSLNINLSYEAS